MFDFTVNVGPALLTPAVVPKLATLGVVSVVVELEIERRATLLIVAVADTVNGHEAPPLHVCCATAVRARPAERARRAMERMRIFTIEG